VIALILGSAGMLGRDLAATVPAGVVVARRSHDECDITDPTSVSRVLDQVRPQWVINASAYTAVDRAETDRDRALAVNGTAPGMLGVLCATRGIGVAHVSTDYVFPGNRATPWREDDATSPVNWYGATKLAGERGLMASGAKHLIVRTQWLFGEHGRSFPRTMWERAQRGDPTSVVNDQSGRPTYTPDLAAALWTLIGRDVTGVLHVTNGGATTWHGVAARIFASRRRSSLLSAVTTADFPTPARRPAQSMLDTTKAESLGVVLPPWDDALDRFLATLT
jgi:dTDP-4-dehydrorhamnose reductase